MKLSFPFSKMTMKSKLYYKLNVKLNCNEVYKNIRECSEQCYFKEKHGSGCLGFIKNQTENNCYICNPASKSDIMASNYIVINNNHLVYILKHKKKKPVMYLPLDEDNITDTTVKGDGVYGFLVQPMNTQVQAGKVNEGLYVRNSGRLELADTATECLWHLALCTKGLSIALWVKPSSLSSLGGHITHNDYSINILAHLNKGISVWTSINFFLDVNTQSNVVVGTWSHNAVVFNPDAGMFVYMDGILDAFKSIDEASAGSHLYRQSDYVFGSKLHGKYPFEGTLDEIKIYYDSLISAGKCT